MEKKKNSKGKSQVGVSPKWKSPGGVAEVSRCSPIVMIKEWKLSMGNESDSGLKEVLVLQKSSEVYNVHPPFNGLNQIRRHCSELETDHLCTPTGCVLLS